MSARVIAAVTSSISRTIPACTTEIAWALRFPTLNQVPMVCLFHRGTLIDRTSSDLLRTVFLNPVKKSRIGISRLPPDESMTTFESRATSAEIVSLAGLAVTILPTTVARLRSCADPISRHAIRNKSNAGSKSVELST